MAMTRKRGRPKLNRPTKDLGTPELQRKHREGVTLEPIDLCLEKALINDAQHKAARRLLWLYRMRHGCPWVKASEWDKEGCSAYMPERDETWHEDKEESLQQALALLEREKCKEALLNICIFQKMPSFLFSHGTKTPREYRELEILRDGLDALVGLWKLKGT